MKRITVVLFLAYSVFLAAGCAREQPKNQAPPAGTKVPVVTGMKNQIFKASSPQRIEMMKGVSVTSITDPDGQIRSVSIAKDNGGISLTCECPGGCTPVHDPGAPLVIGCVVTNDDENATCSGNCQKENASCFGCGFNYTQPGADDPRAAWVKPDDSGLSQAP